MNINKSKYLWAKIAKGLSPAVIVVEEMDKTTAKQRVFDFMKAHGTSDIEELHENIRCDISLLIEIVDELCSEGTISAYNAITSLYKYVSMIDA